MIKEWQEFKGDADGFVMSAGITRPPVDPMAWCRDKELIRVKEFDLRGECDGLLRFRDGRFYLYFDKNPLRRRFNFAHEVAHFLIEEHARAIQNGRGEHESQSGFHTDSVMERQADWFASGLLMPDSLFIPICPDPSWKAISNTASNFDVSLTACALRTI
ncbi:MAG: ImmA/IrrE family metallo-endopeptidase, partial [Myxococcales bacterium]|nr:ImmA/IrrE family metallo-endopeptidase [Myxococcales bacterium]